MEKILGIARTVLSFGGGWLASRGFITEDLVEPLVGAIVTIGVAVWSVLAKSKSFPNVK